MTNDKHKKNNCQELGASSDCSKAVKTSQKPPESCQEPWQKYQAEILQKCRLGYQSPCISPDDTPFTLTESLFAWLKAFDDASPPPEVWAERFAKALLAVASIPEEISDLTGAVEAQPDYSDLFRELIEEVRQTKEIIQSKLGGKNAKN